MQLQPTSNSKELQLNETIQVPQSIRSEKYEKIKGYQMLETLGKGTFGKVKAAKHLLSGQKVAIKIIDKSSIKDKDDQERVAREVQIMRMLRHPNIVQLYEVIESDDHIYLICEYVEQGQLFKLMADQERLGERAGGRIFIQIMNAVEYLHRLGIAHRDLKPENILLDTDFNIKLIDFGLSNFVEKDVLLDTACGSPCYAPPEMVSGNSYLGQVGDIWSLGIIFYGMICGTLPFEEKTTKELYKKVIEGFYVIPSDISLESIEVIRKMLVTNPKERISIPELRKLKFFQQLEEIEPKIIGIIIGFHPMPIDNQILDKMEQYTAFNRKEVEEQIKENEQSNLTTLYYLLQKSSLREGGKTIVDLQAFLESHEKYRDSYGVLPEDESKKTKRSKKQEKQIEGGTFKNSKSKEEEKPENKARQNIRERLQSKIKISNKKGFSKEKRKPLNLVRNQNLGASMNPKTLTSNQKKTHKQSIGTARLHTIQDNRHSYSKDSKERVYRLGHSSSEKKKKLSKKKSSKTRFQNNNRLALNLWDAYFQKPLQQSINKTIATERWTSGNSTNLGTTRKAKQKEQQQNIIFNENMKRLKNGFIKLPMMKKERERDTFNKSIKLRQEKVKTQRQQLSTQRIKSKRQI